MVYLLFRQKAFLLPVGMDSMFAVVWTMGLLIGMGNTVHIMSSMIPVFLMPIAILDDIHILSEFFDRYRAGGDKRQVLIEAMRPLYRPMLFTSLTTAVGFASLALADIPPVQVFGLYMAFGIMGAWLLSKTMVPAVISLMSDEQLEKARLQTTGGRSRILEGVLRPIERLSFLKARTVLIVVLLAFAAGASGLAHLQVNDNPVRWFKPDHPMRVADNVLNRLFGGTYMAYLVVQGEEAGAIKNPKVVTYLDRVQSHMEADPLVGKTSSVADIVKRINLVLHDNDGAYDRVPDTPEAVGQFLFLFQSSGDPDDLDNFIDLDARQANIWVQMKGGDNQQMQQVVDRLTAFVAANPPPQGISFSWSGLTYVNKVWQDLMVVGMLKAILGSFAVVFVLLIIEFRSFALGLLAMIPLSMAILLTYGLAGWVGKDYDMPIAVCSSLTLGLGIDFAIHYMQRFRRRFARTRDLEASHKHMFGEPGLAIARNAIVISLGFLPLVLATLTTYVTVGVFFALLMIFTTLTTLFFLPSVFRLSGERILNGGSA